MPWLEEIYLNNQSSESFSIIPAEIAPSDGSTASSLRVLDVSNNHITSLPESIGLLKQLRSLNASGNKLMLLPDAICNIDQLEVLCMSNNQLRSLPNEFRKLSSLKTLDLSGNLSLTHPPSELSIGGNLQQLSSFLDSAIYRDSLLLQQMFDIVVTYADKSDLQLLLRKLKISEGKKKDLEVLYPSKEKFKEKVR